MNAGRFLRRLSAPPEISQRGRCPDLWELTTGDFAVIGRDITSEVSSNLPPDVILGVEERIVVLPREVLRSAKANIP